MSTSGGEPRARTTSETYDEHAATPAGRRGADRPIGRVRVPITLTLAPWATLCADREGRPYWRVRLPGPSGEPVECRRPTEWLRAYARGSGLSALLAELDRLEARGRRSDPLEERAGEKRA